MECASRQRDFEFHPCAQVDNGVKVFLSSTYRDLEAHRAAVLAALRRVNGVDKVLAMEDWTASPHQTKDECLQLVGEADLFVLIVGALHGFLPAGDTHSITESEFDEAIAQGRRVLAFVANADFPVPRRLREDATHEALQETFRQRVIATVTSDAKWTSPEDLATRVVAAVSNALSPSSPSSTIDLAAYAARCRAKWSAVDLTTVAKPGSLDEATEQPPLANLFIPQDCRRSRPPVSLPRDYLAEQGLNPEQEERDLAMVTVRWKELQRMPALQVVGDERAKRLVILGDPGSGKSSLLRFVLLKLLERSDAVGSNDWRRHLTACFPVLIELRDVVAREAAGRSGDLISYLGYMGQTYGFGFDRTAIDAQLRDHPTLVLIDGLDEIFSPDRRAALVEEIIGLETRFPRSRVIVTSRIAGFNEYPFRSARFDVATLDDLSWQQVQEYATVWFGLAFPGEASQAARARADLVDTLERRPQLKAIAGNPLILTIMAIVARHQRLARSRAQLYRQALETLCYAWDYRRGLKLPADSPLIDLQPDDTLTILRRIASRMQRGGSGLRANAISERDLRDVLEQFFVEWSFPPPRAGRAAAEMLQLLQERNWVLTSRGPSLYGFVHRTFLEYLCALEMAEQFRAQTLDAATLIAWIGGHVADDASREIIRLLAGELQLPIAQQIIESILERTDAAESKPRLTSLAWAVVTEIDPRRLQTMKATCERLTDCLYEFLDRATDADRAPFMEMHASIKALEPDTWPATGPSVRGWPEPFARESALFQAIVLAAAEHCWGARKDALEHLRNRATDEPTRFGLLLTLAYFLPSDDQMYDFTRQAVLNHPDESSALLAAEELPKQYPNRPENFETIATLLRREPIRASQALTILASAFPTRAETWQIVMRAYMDRDSYLSRKAAVDAIADHFATRPQSLALICDAIERDDDIAVRRAAASRLLTSFRTRPEAVQKLRDYVGSDDVVLRAVGIESFGTVLLSDADAYSHLERALSDAAEEIRRAAVTGLSKFTARPETFDQLRDRLHAETSAEIRTSLVEALGHNFPDRAETFAMVAAVARDDRDPARHAAISLLGDRLRGHQDARGVLQGCFQERGLAHHAMRTFVAAFGNVAGALDVIYGCIAHGEPEFRQEAIRSLRHCEAPIAAAPLVRCIANDTDNSVRAVAIEVLAARFPSRETHALLIGCVNDPDSAVRGESAAALAEYFLRRPETLPILRELVRDDVRDVRAGIARALRSAPGHSSETIALLRQLCEDEERIVRENAAYALVTILTPRTDAFLYALGLDPLEPVNARRVEDVSKRLHASAADVRSKYEELVDKAGIPLRLSWRMPAGAA